MTREEAIQIIKNLPIYRMESEYDRESDLMKALKMAVESLGNDTNVGGKWIPCKVDMPKENKTYLTTVYDKATGRRMLKHRECRNGSFKEGGSSRAFPVIAWQPLPEPYKEGET